MVDVCYYLGNLTLYYIIIQVPSKQSSLQAISTFTNFRKKLCPAVGPVVCPYISWYWTICRGGRCVLIYDEDVGVGLLIHVHSFELLTHGTYSLEKLDSFVNPHYDRKTTVSPFITYVRLSH